MRVAPLVLAPLLAVLPGFKCGGDTPPAPVKASFTAGDGLVVEVAGSDPPAITLHLGAASLEIASIAHFTNTDYSVPVPIYGWDHYRGEDGPMKAVARVDAADQQPDELVLHCDGGVTVTFEARDGGLHVLAASSDPNDNRLTIAFKLTDQDHFLGFGERFVHVDQRGRKITTWVEDGGFGHGEDTPPGPSNPSPSGEGQTNVPIPWLLDPRGFAALENTTFRTTYHLGDEADAPGTWRLEEARSTVDVTFFAGNDPTALVEKLTAKTGRPPPIADWVLAPRRRANPGTDEMQKLRDAHVPTSAIDTAVHYFPHGIGTLDAKALTNDIHARGFKAIAYFNPFVATSWHPVYDDAAGKGYLVKKSDGTPYDVLDPTDLAGMVDFTNPDAVAWYQGFMQGAIDAGWDGWMYDFAEYVPQDAVLANGMTGFEAHNLYPVLYQRAVMDLVAKNGRTSDFLVFVRSGYVGTGGVVPMVWAGDQSTDFDLADGLPAALTGALNAGLSGVPLWGSDISGYHYVFNPPPDKELYLRWTELGAFSADMHDENEGAGNTPSSDRWQIWKDQETLDTYKRYAALKTRMVPYVRAAVEQARARGTPVMRQLLFEAPQDPRVFDLGDEYMYGPSLLVAPVVHRGLTNRSVYLPGDLYYDFFTGAAVTGHQDVVVDAPLASVPVFAKAGAIVPMYAADVETVVADPDKSAVSLADRAGFLEVQAFAGPESSLTLGDGTVLGQSADAARSAAAPSDDAGPLPAGDTTTCARCGGVDPVRRVVDVAVTLADNVQSARITAGALVFTVTNSSSVKRYRVVVHY